MYSIQNSERFSIIESVDIMRVRSAIRQMSSSIGFCLGDQTRLATAVSELTRNVLQYAGQGYIEISDISDHQAIGIRFEVVDQGPGIANIELALKDGYSTSGGLGAGLPGTRRLMDSFEIESKPGLTRIVAALSRPKP
jgi:serine/threonine-protein kinase RsbT